MVLQPSRDFLSDHEDDEAQRKAIIELIGNSDVQTVAVATGEEALSELRSSHFDCMVVDLGLPDMSGFDLLERLKKELGLFDLPVIVYTAKELSAKEETRLRKLSESIIVKDVRSPERLLADTSLFLHRASAKLPPAKRKILEEEQRTDPILAGKKVLVVDDDVRNIFSLTSLLERHRMEVLFAENRETPPNRAYLKLWEALTRLGRRPGPGDLCVDLGASPGGWTWVLQRLGARVVSVDKAPLDPSLASLAGIEYRCESAFALDPRAIGPVDWLFSDVVCYPKRLLSLVQKWLAAGTVRRFVCTVKFQGATDFDAMQAFAAKVEEAVA